MEYSIRGIPQTCGEVEQAQQSALLRVRPLARGQDGRRDFGT